MSKDNLTRDIVENFGDPKAVVRESKDGNGDTVKIEIFYGGKDGGDSAGHGHFVAEKIDGIFQTTLDRHPDLEDGGRHEIESWSGRDAYSNEARLDRIRRKKEIIQQISYIGYDDPRCVDKIRALESEFRQVGSCGHEDNIALKEQFKSAKDIFFADRRARQEREYNLTWSRKEDLITRAGLLLYDPNSPASHKEMQRLFDEWKTLPRTTKEKDQQLWERFSAIRKDFYEKRKREYEIREAQRRDAKSKKEFIVSRAESLAFATDFKSAKEEMKSLFDQWKNTPRASKQDEESLWQRFSRARETLYTRAKQDYENRQAQYADAKAKKESIISQAESLCGTSDFRAAAEQMQNLSQQFYNAGNAGRDNQNLKDRFSQVKQRFYDAKRAAGEARHREYLQRTQERLFQKQQSLSRLDDSIYRMEGSISELMSRPDVSYSNPHRFEIAARREAKLSSMREKLTSMKERRLQLIDQISDLQSKIRG